MSKLSPMKNKKQSKVNTENFKTHKNDRDFGYTAARNDKRNNKFAAWGDE